MCWSFWCVGTNPGIQYFSVLPIRYNILKVFTFVKAELANDIDGAEKQLALLSFILFFFTFLFFQLYSAHLTLTALKHMQRKEKPTVNSSSHN